MLSSKSLYQTLWKSNPQKAKLQPKFPSIVPHSIKQFWGEPWVQPGLNLFGGGVLASREQY